MAKHSIPPELEVRFERALEGGDTDGVLETAAALDRTGNLRLLGDWLARAWERHPDPRLAMRLLETYQRYLAWDRFDAVAADALARFPDASELHHAVGLGCEARGRWADAARTFARAAELGPHDIEPRLRQVRALRFQGKPEEALASLAAVRRLHAKDASFHAATGYALIDAGKPAEAVVSFRKALALQPDWQPYLDDLAGALMLSERWQEAAAAAVQSLEHRKRNERAWTVYAVAYSRLGDAQRAEQGFRNAIRAAKDPSRANGNFGLFLARRPERMLEAARFLRAAYRAHPDWDEVGVALRELLEAKK